MFHTLVTLHQAYKPMSALVGDFYRDLHERYMMAILSVPSGGHFLLVLFNFENISEPRGVGAFPDRCCILGEGGISFNILKT